MALRLRRIRALFTPTRKAPNAVVEQGQPGGLPPELLLLVVAYVHDRRDLYALCCTSRALHDVAWPSLYKSIYTAFRVDGLRSSGTVMLDQSAHKKLYRSLQIRGLARMVTDFRICFAPCYTRTRNSRCKCNKFDTMLGQALVSLENLRVLEFKCMCCSLNRNARPGRHRYLGELKNNQLKRLLLRCSCSLWPREDAVRLLTQSSMHRVNSASIGLFSPVLEDLNYLPRLERLEIHGMKTIEPLFKKKAITHLVCKSYHLDTIHRVLGENSGILLHISVEHLMDALPSFIKANLGLYQNLRHLGTLHFGLSEFDRDSARASIQSLSCLPHLVSIELRIMTHEGISIDQTAPHLFDDRINRQARGLAPIQKIYVTVVLSFSFEYSYWIWEIGPRWESRKVPGISSWEIMNGDL